MAELEESAETGSTGTLSSSKKERKKMKTINESSSSSADQIETKSSSNNTSGTKSKEYARMLESFWKLSDYNESTRIEGTRNIVRYFAQTRRGDESYAYVLTRLVKGLASNRKYSRLGYSTCLTEIMSQAATCTLGEVLSLAKSHLAAGGPSDKNNDKQNMLTKEELRHMHIGLLFVYLAWIKSTRFVDSDDATMQTIVVDLNSMRKDAEIKAYIRQLYLQGLIILIKNLTNGTTKNPSIFKSLVLTTIADDLKSVFQSENANVNHNKDNFNLLVACLNAHTDETTSFLKSHSLKTKSLFAATGSQADFIYEILSHSSESLPSLQPICVEMITYLMRHQTACFNQLWSSVIDARLAGKKEPEKKLLAIKFFVLAMSCVDENTYSTLIGSSEQILRTFVSNYVNRQSNLSELMRDEIGKSLVEVVREKDGVITIGADLIIKLISHTRNCHEMSDLIGALIHTLKPASMSKLFAFFTHDFINNSHESETSNNNSQPTEEAQLKHEQAISKQIWMLTQLTAMARNRSSSSSSSSPAGVVVVEHSSEIIDKVLGYLLTNGYFETAKLSAKAVENARSRAIELVGILLATPTTSRLRQIGKSIEMFEKLFKTAKLNEKYLRRKSDLEQLCGRVSRMLKKILDEIKSRSVTSESSFELAISGESEDNDESISSKDIQSIFQTFFMVVCIELFKSFDSFKSSQQAVTDAEICLGKFLDEIAETSEEKHKNKNNKSKKKKGQSESNGKNSNSSNSDGEEEIYWLDVLLEMLLNLITINTTWIRNSVKAQFKKLIPRLRVSSVQLIVDLLNPEADKEDMFGEDEEEEDEDVEMAEEEEEEEEEEKVGKLNGKVNGHLKKSKDKSKEDKDLIEEISFTETALKDQVKENGGKSNGKKRKVEEEESSESAEEEEEDEDEKESESEEEEESDEDEEDSDDDDDEEEDDEVDPELKRTLEKALGSAVANSDTNSDLDDEAMLKLDETIAQAFRARTKDKQYEKEIIQYKSRVLDFIQELFKSTHRLDLTAYLIKPMFELLFETQTKANLKFLSQRILDFLVNVKNSTRKITEARLPSVDDLFELLTQLIKFSTTHFNVTNTLVETSMFCVRLIVHISSVSKSDEQKASILKRLNDIYSEMIRNDKSKNNNSNMYKEYLVRYPANSIPLVIQLIDSASGSDVKVHKKTVTLVILYQCVNNQMFNSCENKQKIDLLIQKIFQFFDEIMEDILKHESFHIKFVDAFVNLVTRVLNSARTHLKRELNEKLAAKLEQLSRRSETKFKQAHKSCFQNLIQVCNRTASQLTD